MRPAIHEGVAATREEEPNYELRRTVESAPQEPVGTGGSRVDDGRCSPDPLQRTDRYRLVTPYVDSSRDL